MKKAKQVLSILLAVVMVVCAVPIIDVEAAYDNNYTNTGNQRADIIGVAQTQVGYTEGSNNSNKYGAYFSHNNVSWCAYFIVWCARQAGVDSSIIKTTGWADADDLGVAYKARGSYTPQSGDIIIFDYSPYNTATPASAHGDHVGLVEYVSNGYVHTIEGNANDMVKRNSYSLSYSEIKGYGVPSYQSATHTHSYITYYEGAHPHRYYRKCSCGDWFYTGQNAAVMTPGYEGVHPHRCYETCSVCKENFLTGTTTTVSSCLECNRPSKPSVNNLKSTYCSAQNITFAWSATTNTTHYNIVIQKKGAGNWVFYKRTTYVSSGVSYQLEAGEYRIQLQAYNSNKWESDGSDWLHTLSSWQYFVVVDHSFNAGTVTKAATCIATGTKTFTCTLCNGTKTETIPINSSNHVNTTSVTATASSCTVHGYSAGVYCNDCKQYISGHAEQPLAAHQTELRGKKDATCTAKGYTGDQYCTVCQNTITTGSSINALGHTAPDANGNCTRCGAHIQNNNSGSQSSGQKLNFFQRIIQAIRDFFAKLFGR